MNDIVRQLRDMKDATRRAEAARILGEQYDLELIHPLIRAAVDDTDAVVRDVASESLHYLLGIDADLAIRSYKDSPDEDTWLLDDTRMDGDAANEGADDEQSDVDFQDEMQLNGLVTVVRGDSDPHMRVKAIRALWKSNDMRVIAALAETVLWTDDSEVRLAARQALEERFGEGADEIIESYRNQAGPITFEDDEIEEEPEEEEYELGNGEFQTEGTAYPLTGPLGQQPPVIKEDRIRWGLIALIIGAIVVGLAVIALFASGS